MTRFASIDWVDYCDILNSSVKLFWLFLDYFAENDARWNWTDNTVGWRAFKTTIARLGGTALCTNTRPSRSNQRGAE
jgi:hypothetical protein